MGGAKRSQRKKRTSKYIGVYQTNAVKPTWEAKIKYGGKLVYGGGAFTTQEQAAQCVNGMCRKFNIPEKNPGLLNEDESDIPQQQYVPEVGDKIQAIQEFFTQTKPKRDVGVNMIMTVQKIDEDGDILVSSTAWLKRSWISKKHFGKIKIAHECNNPMVEKKDKLKRNQGKKHTSVTKTIYKKMKRRRNFKKKVKSSTKMSEAKITKNTPLPTTKPVNKTMQEEIEESRARYHSMISRINSKHGSLEKYITKMNKLHQKNKPQRPKKVRTYVPCPGYVFVIVKRKYWSLPVRGEVIIRSKTIILPTVFKSKEAAEEDIEKREDKIEKNVFDDEIPSNPAWHDQTTKFFIQKVKE